MRTIIKTDGFEVVEYGPAMRTIEYTNRPNPFLDGDTPALHHLVAFKFPHILYTKTIVDSENGYFDYFGICFLKEQFTGDENQPCYPPFLARYLNGWAKPPGFYLANIAERNFGVCLYNHDPFEGEDSRGWSRLPLKELIERFWTTPFMVKWRNFFGDSSSVEVPYFKEDIIDLPALLPIGNDVRAFLARETTVRDFLQAKETTVRDFLEARLNSQGNSQRAIVPSLLDAEF